MDNGTESLIDEVSVLNHFLPSPDTLARMRNSFPSDIHGSLQLLDPLLANEVPGFSDHAFASFTALHNLLEEYEALNLSSIDIVWQSALPLLMG